MDLLFPDDLPLDILSKSERRVVGLLRSSLRQSWLMIPGVKVLSGRLAGSGASVCRN